MNREMGRPELDNVVDVCVEQVETGRATVEDCLKRYPHLADELDPILRTAAMLLATGVPSIDPAGMRTIEKRVLSHARKLKQEQESPRTGLWPQLAVRLAVAMLIVLLVTASTGGALIASADSLPGEPLYPVKRLSENIQLAVAWDTLLRARLHTSFAQRRWDEAMRQYLHGDKWNEITLQEMTRELEHATNALEQINGDQVRTDWERIIDISQVAARDLGAMGAGSAEASQTTKHLHQIRYKAMRVAGEDVGPEPGATRTPAPEIIQPGEGSESKVKDEKTSVKQPDQGTDKLDRLAQPEGVGSSGKGHTAAPVKPEDGPAEVLDNRDTGQSKQDAEQKDNPGPQASGSPAQKLPPQVPQHTPTPSATPEPQKATTPLDDMPKQPTPQNPSGNDQNKADDVPEQGGGNQSGGTEGGSGGGGKKN